MTRSAIPALLGAVLLSACAATPPLAPVAAITPIDQFTPQIRASADEIQLAPHGALSPAQHAALGALVLRWRDAGEGPIMVQAPMSGPAADTGQAVLAALRGFGVPQGGARIHSTEGGDAVPVRVGYSRYQAVAPQCGGFWSDAVRTADNRAMRSFGCSVTANTAAQIANARDLVEAQPADMGDARRRVHQTESYHAGGEPGRGGGRP
jgi:pilus assembly protein CpaD